ncbi:MAG: NuoM family protein [Cyanobacteriota bacterium]
MDIQGFFSSFNTFLDQLNILSVSLLIFAPAIFGLILAGPWFPDDEITIRRTAKAFGWIIFIYSLLFLACFDPDKGLQFMEVGKWPGTQYPWIKALGINYIVSIDGLSMPLVLLTTFITLLSLYASKENITKRFKLYYSMVLILTTAVLGVFCAQDLFLFFLFWELELIPMYFLIAIWGSGRAQYSAIKFVLYTLVGSVFILAAILILYFSFYNQTGKLTFDMYYLGQQADYPIKIQLLAFVGFFIGFCVKLPAVPFHTWLPDAHVDAPTPISMILAGILLKMGGYGLLRFNFGFLGEALQIMAPYVALFAVISILYGAMVALSQEDMKKLVAYSSVSHMGIVLLGLAAFNSAGINGAMFQMLAHGVISAGLFMLVGTIYIRAHTRIIDKFGGLFYQMPVLSSFFILIGLAGLGLPLMVGFAAESLTFYGAFTSDSFSKFPFFGYDLPLSIQFFSILGIIGIIVTAAYILWLLERVFFGPMFEKWKPLSDTTLTANKYQEVLVLCLLSLSIIFFGCFPKTITRIFEPTITKLVETKTEVIVRIPISNYIGVAK